MAESHNSGRLTDAEIAHALSSRRCAVCNGAKAPGRPFCATDFLALPLHLRQMVTADPAAPSYAEHYRRAVAHLRGMPTRAVRILPSGARWAHDSHESLAAAGYRLIEYGHCAVPKCPAALAWYWTPDRRRLALNFPAYTPHRDTCRDPAYFTRRRANVRTSAKRAASKGRSA